MSLHPERKDSGLYITGNRSEIMLIMTEGNIAECCRIYNFDQARKIAEDILQCIKEGSDYE